MTNNIITKAVKKVIYVDRNDFLRKIFPAVYSSYGNHNNLPSPLQAGVNKSTLKQKALSVLRKHRLICSSISGGITFMTGPVSIPVDVAQYYENLFTAAQKIAYIYGMQDLRQADDQTEYECLVALFYIMIGHSIDQSMKATLKRCMEPVLNKVIDKIVKNRSSKEVMQRIIEFAVTKMLGETVSKKGLSRVLGKLVPCVSGAVSFALTWGFFTKACNRLITHFERQVLAAA